MASNRQPLNTTPTVQVGERVRHARLSAGLTQDEVVARLAGAGYDITKAGLSKYELGKSVPGATFLLKLGQALNVPSAYFLREQEVKVAWGGYRKKSTLTQLRQDQIRAYAIDMVEAHVWLQTRLQIRTEGILSERRPGHSLEDAEAAADWLRKEWELSDLPLESVTQVVEDRGGIVVPVADGDADFDGLSGWVNGKLPLAVVNQAVSDDRRRYNLAHELGHLILDCSGLTEREEELRAHRFAAAFIVPAEAARRELGPRRRHLSMHELAMLKAKYGFSMQAWMHRACELEIIDGAYYKGLCVEFSRRRWRKLEPFKYTGNETPTRLKQLTLRALSEGLINRDQAERLCPGCVETSDGMEAKNRMSPRELLKLPYAERARILALAAADAAEVYAEKPELSDFEALSEDDFE